MAGDPLWYYKVLGLHCDGTNGSTTFTDVCGKTVTANGNAQISTAQYAPITGNSASCILDGTGDYLSLADHADFEFGSGNFTMRCKLRIAGWSPSYGGSYYFVLFSKDSSSGRSYSVQVVGTSSSFTTLRFVGFSDNSNSTTVDGSYSFALDTWYDIEVVRSGNLIYLFVNGVLLNAGGTAFSRTLQNTSNSFKIGAHGYDATFLGYLNGYVDDIEAYKAVALHTSNFTPATAPFADEYVSISGTTKDSSGSFASRLVRVYRRDTGSLVGEVVSNESTGTYKVIAANSGTTTPLKHFAVCYDPSIFTLYRVLGLHCNGTNGSTTFTDVKGNTVTANGNAQISTAQYPALTGKTSSALFDGAGDYLSIPDSADWDFGSGDFTIRFLCRPTSTSVDQEIIAQRKTADSDNFWFVRRTSAEKIRVVGKAGGSIITDVLSTGTLTVDSWQLVEIVRTSGSVKISIAGTFGTAVTTDGSGSWPNVAHVVYVGVGDDTFSAGNFYNGYLSEIEIYKGVALHTADFTPSTIPFTDSTTATENALIYDDLTPT